MTQQELHQISSKENVQIKHAVKLMSNKKYRQEKGLFIVEGLRLCTDAILSGLHPKQVFLTESQLQNKIESILSEAEEGYLITENLAEKISDTENTQGIFCVFPMLDINVPLKNIPGTHFVLLSSLQDPGNIGTIIRTSEAFGIDMIIVSSDCPDIYSPKLLRATMGGIFRVKIKVTDDICHTIEELRKQGVEVYAAALHEKSQCVTDVSFKEASAVVIGNEGNGLSQKIIDACSTSILIPMDGNAESLNAAIAASILVWEMARQTHE